MKEADVIDLLGKPNRTVDLSPDATLMRRYFFESTIKKCLPKPRKVLVYDRWIRNDIGVALDEKGVVACFEIVNFF